MFNSNKLRNMKIINTILKYRIKSSLLRLLVSNLDTSFIKSVEDECGTIGLLVMLKKIGCL